MDGKKEGKRIVAISVFVVVYRALTVDFLATKSNHV